MRYHQYRKQRDEPRTYSEVTEPCTAMQELLLVFDMVELWIEGM